MNCKKDKVNKIRRYASIHVVHSIERCLSFHVYLCSGCDVHPCCYRKLKKTFISENNHLFTIIGFSTEVA